MLDRTTCSLASDLRRSDLWLRISARCIERAVQVARLSWLLVFAACSAPTAGELLSAKADCEETVNGVSTRYDAAGRPTQVGLGEPGGIQFTYDGLGSVTSNGKDLSGEGDYQIGSACTWVAERPLVCTIGFTSKRTWEYEDGLAVRLVEIFDYESAAPSTTTTTWQYDGRRPALRLMTHDAGPPDETEYTYDASGRLVEQRDTTRATTDSVTVTAWTWSDEGHLLQRVQDEGDDGYALVQTDYFWNEGGQYIGFEKLSDGVQTDLLVLSWTRGRIASWCRTGSDEVERCQYYSYRSGLIARTDDTEDGELVSAVEFDYDAAGRQIERGADNDGDGVIDELTTFTWSCEGGQ